MTTRKWVAFCCSLVMDKEEREELAIMADSPGTQNLTKREQKRLERQRKRDEKKQSRRDEKNKCAADDKVCCE